MIHTLFGKLMLSSPKPDDVPGDVTLLLRRIAGGEEAARNVMIDLLYPELKQLAEVRMRRERSDHTLQPSALVNEFFLEIARGQVVSWRDRTHFMAVASQAMRRFLIDYARAHNSQRRGRGVEPLQFEDIGFRDEPIDAIMLGDLLGQLAAEEPRMAQVVDMRCFGGLTHAEIGDVLGIDERTVKRDWKVARAWMRARIESQVAKHDR